MRTRYWVIRPGKPDFLLLVGEGQLPEIGQEVRFHATSMQRWKVKSGTVTQDLRGEREADVRLEPIS